MDGIKLYYFDKLKSTNDKAKEVDYPENKYIIYTSCQTDGRGQNDHKWISKNGITFSIVIKAKIKDASMLAPEAIIKYLKSKGIDAKIKYPNDIYYNGKKLGGILTETIYKENFFDKTIIGIGLNINETSDIEELVDNSICISLNESIEEIIKGIFHNLYEIIMVN